MAAWFLMLCGFKRIDWDLKKPRLSLSTAFMAAWTLVNTPRLKLGMQSYEFKTLNYHLGGRIKEHNIQAYKQRLVILYHCHTISTKLEADQTRPYSFIISLTWKSSQRFLGL